MSSTIGGGQKIARAIFCRLKPMALRTALFAALNHRA
jgi:hypothetical protein